MSFPAKVFYINLDKREDRRKEFEEEFGSHFDMRRISGVVTEKTGWLGCTHAHINALTAALYESEDPYACIMEDDAILVRGMEDVKSAFGAGVSRGFDVLMLNVLYEKFVGGKGDDAEEGGIKRLAFANSTAAYVVRRSYLPTLIEGFRTALVEGRKTHDREAYALDMWMNCLVKRDTWLTALPNPIHQRDSFSDIDMRFDKKEQSV